MANLHLAEHNKDFSEMNYNLKEAFEIAYDRHIYTQLVCRAVARSHQADWWCKRRLKEETASRKCVDDDDETYTEIFMKICSYVK